MVLNCATHHIFVCRFIPHRKSTTERDFMQLEFYFSEVEKDRLTILSNGILFLEKGRDLNDR